MATALGVCNTQLEPLHTLIVFGISLVLFTSAFLIGAAIKTDLEDQLISILISFLVMSVISVIVAVVFSFWDQFKFQTIGVYMGVQLIFFIISFQFYQSIRVSLLSTGRIVQLNKS
ncbi:unnamed protein product [Schistosoma spindalis]|nr:unnamed protein product [Schistosoma spindale]